MPKKKYVIQVAGNPQYAKKPSPATPINNPSTGLALFGTFPAIDSNGTSFVGGPIYLRYGKHEGVGKGFGFEHIWQARFPNCVDQMTAAPFVTALINSILVSGASIHYEYGLGTQGRRSSVFRSSAGVLVVEERFDGNNNTFYSIVTAIQTQKVNGAQIGAIT